MREQDFQEEEPLQKARLTGCLHAREVLRGGNPDNFFQSSFPGDFQPLHLILDQPTDQSDSECNYYALL